MNVYSISADCTGCTACARRCPVGAISGQRGQRHVVDQNACVRCGLCGRICPAKAVADTHGTRAQRVPKKDWKHPVVDAPTCAGCSLCVIECPVRCLEIGAPAFHGDTHTVAVLARPDSCIGCGLCAQACPIDAIRMEASA